MKGLLTTEHERLVRLIQESVSLLCKSSLTYDLELNVEGLLGITLDKKDIFLVNIHESFQNRVVQKEAAPKSQQDNQRDVIEIGGDTDEDRPSRCKKKRNRKRSHEVLESERNLNSGIVTATTSSAKDRFRSDMATDSLVNDSSQSAQLSNDHKIKEEEHNDLPDDFTSSAMLIKEELCSDNEEPQDFGFGELGDSISEVNPHPSIPAPFTFQNMGGGDGHHPRQVVIGARKNSAPESETRFGLVQSTNSCEGEDILHAKHNANTQKATKASVRVLRSFLIETEGNAEFEKFSVTKLNDCLRRVYLNAKRTDGSNYKKSSLKSLRLGLARHLSKVRDINILYDLDYKGANDAFDTMMLQLERDVSAQMSHYPSISQKDLDTLYAGPHNVFNIDLPEGLQNKVWFEIMLYICRSARDMHKMTKDNFAVATDKWGREYVYHTGDGGDRPNDISSLDSPGHVHYGRMYDIPGSSHCPVASFKKYISKLCPYRKDLWQLPVASSLPLPTTHYWYNSLPLGHKTIAKKMASISKAASLSTRYTNCCIRATAAAGTFPSKAGCPRSHVMQTVGHACSSQTNTTTTGSGRTASSDWCQDRSVSDSCTTSTLPSNTSATVSNKAEDLVRKEEIPQRSQQASPFDSSQQLLPIIVQVVGGVQEVQAKVQGIYKPDKP